MDLWFSRLLWACSLGLSLIWTSPVHALFLGRQDGDRDWSYNAEYFMHRASYRIPAAWDAGWESVRAGFRGTAGSSTTEDLLIEEEVRLDKDLDHDGAWRLGFQYWEAEDYDLRYARTEVSLWTRARAAWGLRVFGEPVAEKEFSDFGLGLTWGEPRGNHAYLEAVAVDFPYNRKASTGSRYDDKPYTLRLGGRAGQAALRVSAGLELDLPLDLRDAQTGRRITYRMERARVTARGTGTARWWKLDLWAETARVAREPLPGSPGDFLATRRGAVRAQGEAGGWRALRGVWSAGLLIHYLHEGRSIATDPGATRSDRRLDLGPHLTWQRPLSRGWSLGLDGLTTWIERRGREHAQPALSGTKRNLESKLGVFLEYSVDPDALFRLRMFQDLDEFRFGGGNILFQITF